MKDPIATRKLLFVSPSGEKIPSEMRIGRPYLESRCWCCILEIDGIDKPRCGCGADSLQSVLLTVSIAQTLLETLVKEGWKILWPDSGEETTPAELFEARECEHLAGKPCQPADEG